ncbi:DUF4292 domain-containing protein [Prevotella sp. P2-180]|uniref:DUF4292 domain-containing protein n=1 Tax=Prevotella sp. P2-180 TaxID=2024224 RepID=UPI000B97A7A4|nr:DUF4292 domain-containing protein [Prevotella sp. P2-180]MCI7257502.1 DUF4292 domain-containing protein [Prevotella sp.]MDD6862782.1 DUF4292 domain-containing protein [Prevotella sp.]OYP67760.1 hypothetical protein CIK98_04490 [Prevotella sp. P2-180]
MRISSFLKVAVVAMPMALASCKSTKNVVTEPKPVTQEMLQTKEILQKVNENSQNSKFITSKIRFQVQIGNQDLSLTGNLKMKRDDVIRLQLMAFGFVEAARLEFTKDYVLLMDRINKQYLRASYEQVDFLRNSGLNFYSLQALFWNELFQPGQAQLNNELLEKFQTNIGGDDVIISMGEGNMNYKWLANQSDGKIRMANILYKDRIHGNSQLNWDYSDFKTFDVKSFPMENKIIFTSNNKEVKINMTLNYVGTDSDWETRTSISSKYKEVSVDDILRRLMSL